MLIDSHRTLAAKPHPGTIGEMRVRALGGALPREQFNYYAAQHYLADDKPLRAKILLQGMGDNFRPDAHLPQAKEPAARTHAVADPKPRCALIMIVRDEEECIGNALESADSIADQIIIVDTGSRDSTVEIATFYGATIVPFVWEDDFSRARNAALPFITCDHVLWMDADDRIDPRALTAVRELVNQPARTAYALRVINQRPGNRGPEFMQVRIFPAHHGIEFERRIHEQLLPSLRNNGIPVVHRSDIGIIHSGYRDQLTHQRKARRNLPLILSELKSRPADVSLLLSLGDCHTVVGDLEAGINAYARITEEHEYFRTNLDIYTQALFYRGWLEKRRGNIREAKRNLFRCAMADPTRIEAFHLLGVIFYEEKRYERAYELFISSSRISSRLRSTATDHSSVRMESISYVIRILLKWECIDQAEEVARRAIAVYPKVVEYYSLLGTVLLKRGALKEAASRFMHSIALSPCGNSDSYCGIARIYLALDDPEKAAQFLRQGVQNGAVSSELHLLLGDTLFSLHQPDAAIQAYQWALDNNELQPEQRQLLCWKALSLALESGHTQQAQRLAHCIIALDPDNDRARQLLHNIQAEEKCTQVKKTCAAPLSITPSSGIGTAKLSITNCR